MSIEQTMQQFIAGADGISSVVGDRVYPVFAGVEPAAPYCIVSRAKSEPEYSLRGQTAENVVFRVTFWARTPTQAIALGKALCKAVNIARTNMTIDGVSTMTVADIADDCDPGETQEDVLFARRVDVRVKHTDID